MRLLILLAFVFFSCNNNPQQEKSNTDEQKEDTTKVIINTASQISPECFWKIMQRDTFVASLIQKDNKITGKLSFDNFQKDGSSGPVQGIVEGKIIKLWYSFQSEGTNSVMEVWFKKQDDVLIRGIGPSAVKADTSYFTDHSAIKFEQGQVLQRVDCKVVPAKYK